MTTRKKHKTIIILPVAFLVTLGLASLYVGGLYKIDTIKQEVRALEDEVDQINTEGSEVRRQTLILKEILPAQEILKQYFINRNNIVPFIDYLEEISGKVGVTIRHNNNQIANSLNFTLSFEGEFN
ncbi:MAG: hypothetical protein KAS07_04930, partial [Candidatus Pacebacteria bacterium]|nr:hypothetical protein [Candidatus Paceibacterota bacterium]